MLRLPFLASVKSIDRPRAPTLRQAIVTPRQSPYPVPSKAGVACKSNTSSCSKTTHTTTSLHRLHTVAFDALHIAYPIAQCCRLH